MVVGGGHRLPEDPCEYNSEASLGPGCNNLHCENCGARVRNSAPGFRVKDSQRSEDLPALYASDNWFSPFVVSAHADWRLYVCKCAYWEEGSTHFVINDHDSPGDPYMNWVCGGHPTPELPMTLGKLTISSDTNWPALVKRVLDGACPRMLERADEGPWLWLSWLYSYLDGLSTVGDLSKAIADRLVDADTRVVVTVLAFFQKFPTAAGIGQVIAHAKADPAIVAIRHVVAEDDVISLWDVLLGVLRARTMENPAREVVDLIRKVMLLPIGDHDPFMQTMARSWEANAFKRDDATWMAENIVALEAAGRGRWKPIMNLVVAYANNDAEAESMVLIAGVALIQSGRVPHAEIRSWIKQRAYPSDAWALVLESALNKAL
jgi:hypothetical protein